MKLTQLSKFEIQLYPVNLIWPFFQVDFTTKFCDSMMFNLMNNLLNILMIFKNILFNDFHLMLLSSLLRLGIIRYFPMCTTSTVYFLLK